MHRKKGLCRIFQILDENYSLVGPLSEGNKVGEVTRVTNEKKNRIQ